MGTERFVGVEEEAVGVGVEWVEEVEVRSWWIVTEGRMDYALVIVGEGKTDRSEGM